MANVNNQFDVPPTNIERAVNFYSELIATELPWQEIMEILIVFFNLEGEGVGGLICR